MVARRLGPALGRGAVGPGLVGRRRRRPDQPPEVPGPVQAHQDLAQQAREADRLAAQLEDVDRRVHHGPRGLRRPRTARRPPGQAARTAGPRARRPGRRPRRASATAPRSPASAGRRARRPSRAARARPRRRSPDPPRAAGRRRAGSPPTTPPSTQATSDSGASPSSSSTARAFRVEDRLDAAQGAGHRGRLPRPRRPRPPARTAARAAASRRPRARAPTPCRGRPRRAARRPAASAGCPRPAGSAAARRSRRGWATSSWSAPSAAEVPCLSIAVAEPSARLRRSSPRRAGTGPQAPLSRRWTKPRTSRTPSSNASHGLRSRQWAPPGRRTWPPAIFSGATRPGDVASRLAGPSAWRIERRSAAAIGAARRSPSTRSRIAASADSWRGVWRSSSSSASDSPPSRTGNRSSRNARASPSSRSRASRRSFASSGAWRCSPPPSWSRQTGQR